MAYLKNQKLLDDLGAHVKKLRQEKGMTLEDLANESEIELSQVHRIEKGQTNLYLSTLDAIAKGLGTTLGELLKGF